jgi:hypothetical protein
MRPTAVARGGIARRFAAALVRWRWFWLTCAWIVALAAGYLRMLTFETKPGAAGDSGPSWPQQTQMRLANEGMTLVMFLHPQCPCSSASVDQLRQLVERHPAVGATYLLMVEAGNSGAGDNSALMADARQVPGATVCMDSDGQLARSFDCRTSGHLYVFDRAGKLRFDGGITSARGHAGPNAAADAAATAIDAGHAPLVRMPVFGCALF